MTKHRYSAVGQLLLWSVFLGPALYAYFVWHWPLIRVFLVCLFAFGLFLGGLFTFGSLLSEITRRRRSKVMIEAANQLDLRCYPGQFHRELLPDEVWNSWLLRSTDNDVRNLLHGVAPDADLKMFDAYINVVVSEPRPWTSDDRLQNVMRQFQQTVACVTSSKLQLPRFSLLHAAENDADPGLSAKVSFEPLTVLFRGDETETLVQLQAASTFSARYELRSTDPQAARQVFHARVVALFEAESDMLACGEGQVFLLFRENHLADVSGVKNLLKTAMRLAKWFSSPAA